MFGSKIDMAKFLLCPEASVFNKRYVPFSQIASEDDRLRQPVAYKLSRRVNAQLGYVEADLREEICALKGQVREVIDQINNHFETMSSRIDKVTRSEAPKGSEGKYMKICFMSDEETSPEQNRGRSASYSGGTDSKNARKVLEEARQEMNKVRFEKAKQEERKEINVLDFLDGPSVWTAVKKFSGTEDEPFSRWIVQMEDRFDLAEAAFNDAQKIARVKIFLRGAARSYFDELPAAAKADYARMKAALSDRFASTASKPLANQKLSAIQQRKGENVLEYAERVRKLVETATAGEAAAVKSHRLLHDFIRGLEPAVRIMVKKDDPDTYEKAVEKARKFESLLEEEGRLMNAAEINRIEVTPEKSEGDKVRDEVSRLTQMIGTLAQKVNEAQRGPIQAQMQMYRDTRNPDGKMVCNHCGRTGHRMANCFRRRDGLPPIQPRRERQNPQGNWSPQYGQREINVLDTLGLISYRSIKQFSGTDDEPFEDWVRQLDDSFELAETPLDEAQKAARLKYFLTGAARSFFDDLPDPHHEDYSSSVARLKARFDGKTARSLANQKLCSISQRPNETVTKYAERVRELVHAATRGLDGAIRDHSMLNDFVKGLKPALRITVKRDEPANFQEALHSAKRHEILFEEEGLLAEKPRVRNAEVTAHSPLNDLKELKRQLTELYNQLVSLQGSCYAQPVNDNRRYIERRDRSREQRFQGQARWNAIPTRAQENRIGDGKCFKCNQEGHWARDCREKPLSTRFPQRKPYAANRDGAQERNNSYNGRLTGANATPLGTIRPLTESPAMPPAKGAINTLSAGKDFSEPKSSPITFTRPSPEQWQFRPGMGMKPSKQINVMERNDSFQVRTRGTKGLKQALAGLVFICTMVSIFAQTNMTSVGSAMICHPNASSQLWKMPSKHACQVRIDNDREKALLATIDIFQPNVKRYETTAFHCKKIRTITTYTGNLMNQKSAAEVHEQLSVTSEECFRMHEHRQCDFGTLQDRSGIWMTDDVPAADDRWWVFALTEKKVETRNCYLYNTVVIGMWGRDHIISPAGKTETCAYTDEHCPLGDGSVIIWKKDKTERCPYLKMVTWNGIVKGGVWISDSEEFALSFPRERKVVGNCEASLH